MNIETRKLQLISDFLKIDDVLILDEIEAILKKEQSNSPVKKSLENFAGIWNQDEANEMKKNIEAGCEQINDEDW